MIYKVEVRIRGSGFTVGYVTRLTKGFVAEFASEASWNDLVFS